MSTFLKKKDTLFNLLNEFYQSKGLEFDKKKSIFSDRTRQIYWYPYHKSSKRIIYQPRISLRFPTIQKIQDKLFPNNVNFTIHRVAGKPLKKELAITKDYLFEEKFLIEDRSFLYVIDETEETNPNEIAKDHIQFMDNIGHKLFDLLSSVNLVEGFINRVPLFKPAHLLTENDISSIRMERLTQEVHAGLIAAYLIEKNRGIKLAETYILIYHDNQSLINDINKISTYFNQLNQPLT